MSAHWPRLTAVTGQCKLFRLVMISELGAARIHDRIRWERLVRAALRRHGEDRVSAAVDLGVSLRVLRRWVRELGFERIQPRPPKGPRAA